MTETMAAADYQGSARERQMIIGIRQAVGLVGGYCWHCEDTRHCPELTSLPDLVVLVPGTVAMLELKSRQRGFERGQVGVAALLATVERALCGVVRPVPRRPGELAYDDVVEALGR